MDLDTALAKIDLVWWPVGHSFDRDVLEDNDRFTESLTNLANALAAE